MENTEDLKKDSVKKISKSIIASFFRTYGLIPLNLIMTAILSRSILQETWNILLFALGFINGAQFLLIFFPPSIQTIMYYKVAEYSTRNEKENIKGLTKYTLLIKFVLGTIVTLCYFIIGWIWKFDPDPIMQLKGEIIMITSFTLLFTELNNILLTLFESLCYFGYNSYSIIINKLFFLFGYLFLRYNLNDQNETFKLYFVAYITVLAQIIQFASLIPLYYKLFHKVSANKFDLPTIKSFIQSGFHFTISNACGTLYEQYFLFQLEQGNSGVYQTYFNIPRNMINQATLFAGLPMGSIFTNMEQKGQRNEMLQLFVRSSFLFSVVLVAIIGVLYYGFQIYIGLIYPLSYIDVYFLIRPYVFTIYFSFMISNLTGLIGIFKQERLLTPISIITLVVLIAFSLLGWTISEFYGIILFRMIGTGIVVLVYWYFIRKFFQNKTRTFFMLMGNFFACIGIIVIIGIFSDSIDQLVDASGLISFLNSILTSIPLSTDLQSSIQYRIPIFTKSTIKIAIFLILLFVYIWIGRIITKQDIANLQKMGIKIPLAKYLQIFVPNRKSLVAH